MHGGLRRPHPAVSYGWLPYGVRTFLNGVNNLRSDDLPLKKNIITIHKICK